MMDAEPFLRELLWLRDSWKSLPDARKLDRVLQDALDAVQELYAVQEYSPAGHLLLDRRGYVARANLAARHLLRHLHGPLVGRRLYDFVPSDHRDALFQFLRGLWKADRPKRLALPLKRREGKEERRRWIRLDGQADVRNRGAAKIIAVNLTDVTEEHRLTEELRAERARLEAVVEQMPAAVFISDADTGRISLHNRLAKETLGDIPPMETWTDYERFGSRHPDGRPFRWDEYPMVRAIREGHTFHRVELLQDRPEGKRNTYLISAGPIRDATGRIVAGVLTLENITAQKEAQREQALLAAVVSSSDDAIIRKKLDGTITHWNPAAERMYGYSADEMVGRHARALVPDALAGEEARLISHVARGQKIRALETVRLGKGGRRIDVSVTVTLIRDEDGRPEAVSSIERDVTERKRVDLELLTSRRQLELATTAGEVGLWTYDLLAGTSFWNAQLYYMLGLQPRRGPEPADAFMKFIHPEDRAGSLESLDRLIREHGHFSMEFRIVRADGKVRWVVGKGKVERDENGEPVFMRGINIDITERRMAEKALEASREELAKKVKMLERSNQELSEFAYAVSHDLKAPFRAVRNYANFLEADLEDTLAEEAAGYLRGMKKAIAQGDQLIGDLLDFSRIRKNVDPREKIDLPALVAEIASLLDTGPDAKVLLPEKAPPVYAERSLLKRALMNLISNGLKFNESETKRVEIIAHNLPGERVRIRVRDNGIGIDPSYHGQVFRIFQRLHGPSAYEGTGIGLAIVKKAVLAMGGAVRLESAAGRGSTFIIDLPNRPSEPENAEAEE